MINRMKLKPRFAAAIDDALAARRPPETLCLADVEEIWRQAEEHGRALERGASRTVSGPIVGPSGQTLHGSGRDAGPIVTRGGGWRATPMASIVGRYGKVAVTRPRPRPRATRRVVF